MSKGILGIGCSFTWGESLYYYSDLDNLPVTKYHEFDNELINISMLAYKDKHRFIRKLADYYDTWELVLSNNGGNNENTFIDTTWTHLLHGEIDITDFKLVVWQITQWERSTINSDIDIIEYHNFLHSVNSKHIMKSYFNWRENLEEYEIRRQLTFIDEISKEFESYGIKVVTIVWPESFLNYEIYNDKFKERHVPIQYKDKIYDSFESLFFDTDYELTVKNDFKSENVHMNDTHFGLHGQEVLKNSIIKKLEQDNFKI